MATLRLLAFCTIISTALSFVALAPLPSCSAPVSDKSFLARTMSVRAGATRPRMPVGMASARGSMQMMERTYIMIKPDGVQRGLVSNIIGRFEQRGYKLVALKLTTPARATLEQHYKDLASKPFFPKLMTYMTSGPVVAMVWEGKDVVATGRKMLGATNPLDSAPGTIRGDFCIEVSLLGHGGDRI